MPGGWHPWHGPYMTAFFAGRGWHMVRHGGGTPWHGGRGAGRVDPGARPPPPGRGRARVPRSAREDVGRTGTPRRCGAGRSRATSRRSRRSGWAPGPEMGYRPTVEKPTPGGALRGGARRIHPSERASARPIDYHQSASANRLAPIRVPVRPQLTCKAGGSTVPHPHAREVSAPRVAVRVPVRPESAN